MSDELQNKLHRTQSDDDDDDEEDGDYVPSEHEVSEEESSGEEDDDIPKDKSLPKKDDTAIKEVDKSRADALWADFMADVGTPGTKRKSETTSKPQTPKSQQTHTNMVTNNKPKLNPDPSTAKPTTHLPGAAPSSAATASGFTPTTAGGKRAGGLSAVLGFINKKQKISTLDKSKLDWEKYKSEAGLSEELKAHRNSNKSYLERKEFLERADQRQFEKEKEARAVSRSKR